MSPLEVALVPDMGDLALPGELYGDEVQSGLEPPAPAEL